MYSVLSDPFVSLALLASVVVGIICAYLGVHVVLRRIVFVGAALAQVSSAGVGFALYADKNPSLTSLIFTLGGVAAFSFRGTDKKTTRESLIGVGYAIAASFAVLFVAKSAQGEAHLLDVLSGNILTVTSSEIWWMAGVGVSAITLHTVLHKQLLFSAFDPETAQALGIRTAWWDLLFFLILGTVISFAIRLAGTLLVFDFLVVPAVTALLLVQQLNKIYAIAVGAAVVASIVGMYASIRLDLPSGPTMVAVSCLLLVGAWIISRIRS